MTSHRLFVPVLGLSLILSAGLTSRAQEGKVKDPESKHGLTLKVRQSTEEDFGKDTRRYGVELYQDLNNTNGLYISDAGSIAAEFYRRILFHVFTCCPRGDAWCLCIRDSRNFDLQRFSPESWRRGPRAGRH